ncbi:hypothetical protein ACQR1Y_30395 [Bradyrhizobium sp. HKCCYLRH3099]|uniref:hypothetical protein n=1 Tax=unclassified Bradyrhizobium TaxID=2631580 RepID=UPI003EBE2A80
MAGQLTMPRNMIASNVKVFGALDRFCSIRADPVRNSDQKRWIATQPAERTFLKDAILSEKHSFGLARGLARFNHETASFFFTLGFDHASPFGAFTEIDVDGGKLTAILAELHPRPRQSPALVRQYVEVEDASIPGYTGHDHTLIASLFPEIRCFVAKDIAPEETWRIFFLFCIQECRQGESWIDETLADTLQTICELEQMQIPYRTLCRSVFDSDPATMFLALYRCLESLYAYSSAEKVITSLGLSKNWGDVAAALEDALDWHPREETSLIALLTNAIEADLVSVFDSLGEQVPTNTNDVATSAAKRIYRLRNGLVHFRPYHHGIDHGAIDWNRLCTTMAIFVFDIYYKIFRSPVTAGATSSE